MFWSAYVNFIARWVGDLNSCLRRQCSLLCQATSENTSSRLVRSLTRAVSDLYQHTASLRAVLPLLPTATLLQAQISRPAFASSRCTLRKPIQSSYCNHKSKTNLRRCLLCETRVMHCLHCWLQRPAIFKIGNGKHADKVWGGGDGISIDELAKHPLAREEGLFMQCYNAVISSYRQDDIWVLRGQTH